MKLHKESHTDHLSPELLAYVLERFADRGEFFIETIEVPADIAESAGLVSALYGPAAGDPPVTDEQAYLARRPGRGGASRMIKAPVRPTRFLTVIAGPHKDEPCVLYTAHGGPPAPREPWEFWDEDDFMSLDAIQSSQFWDRHALADGED